MSLASLFQPFLVGVCFLQLKAFDDNQQAQSHGWLYFVLLVSFFNILNIQNILYMCLLSPMPLIIQMLKVHYLPVIVNFPNKILYEPKACGHHTRIKKSVSTICFCYSNECYIMFLLF